MSCVDICVATRKRPIRLRSLLTSLEGQRLPADVQVRVIVADNDAKRSAAPVVREFRDRGAAVTYDCEPVQNIALARNLALRHAKAEWVASIDDDAVADPDWLARLLEAAERFGADAVFGAVRRELPDDAPAYLRDSGVYQLPNPETGATEGFVANTINALYRRDLVAGREGPFNPAFGRTGGEDTKLFAELAEEGARLVWCREARVVERVLPERARLGWLLQRTFREGMTNYRVNRHWNIKPRSPMWVRFAHLGGRVACGGVVIPLEFALGAARYEWRLRAVRRMHVLFHDIGIAAQTAGLTYVEYRGG